MYKNIYELRLRMNNNIDISNLNEAEKELLKIEEKIENIIGDRRFITVDDLKEIEKLDNVFIEDNGVSSKLDCNWYTVCLYHEDSELDIESINLYVK